MRCSFLEVMTMVDAGKLAQFLFRHDVTSHETDRVMTNLAGLFSAADKHIVKLAAQRAVDKAKLLRIAQAVLKDDNPGETRGFTVQQVRLVPITEARCLCSKNVGTARCTDWPPPGISSFGVSSLLYLRFSADMRSDIFCAVHELAHETLLKDLQSAILPDGGSLGGAWNVLWSNISDAVFFYLTQTIMGTEGAAALGEFVQQMPDVLPIGFWSKASHEVSHELIAICD
ncbi:MAG: hypothetical protein V1738_01845 [Patescibacteria group bacterium]